MAFAKLLVMVELVVTPFLFSHENCRIEVFKGAEIIPYVKKVTDLSLAIYREYPYLYEGTEEEYMPFIEHYAKSELGMACILFDDEKPVGVAIGMPMDTMRKKYQEPLLSKYPEANINSFFYLGEFLILKEYRGKGFGKQIYVELEQSIKKEKLFKTICFCKIDEFELHPLKPDNYKSLDEFWRKLGFEQVEDLSTSVAWRNINELEDSPHKMVYWIKTM